MGNMNSLFMKMIKDLIVLLCVILLVSCSSSETGSIEMEVNRWMGTDIQFPENSVFTIQGRDTVDFQFQDAPYKILTYVDSVGCMSCKLQLENWSKYIQELDSVTGSMVPVTFFINAPTLKELAYITRRDGFKHPVCFNKADELNRLNHFSDEMMYQTFLLDRDNRVVGIGNPVNNPNVKALYYRIIQGESAKAPTRKSTTMALDVDEINFGRFSIGKEQITNVTITNTGSELLIISDVTTSCGCTEVEFSREPVRSGQSTALTVRDNPDEKGYFSKTISIYSNAGTVPATIALKGNVE